MLSYTLADKIVGKRPRTSYEIQIHFAVVFTYIFCFPL